MIFFTLFNCGWYIRLDKRGFEFLQFVPHKFAGLISGGKDSIFSISKLIQCGHDLICLANLYPIGNLEIDSYMFQSVGSEIVGCLNNIIGVPLYRQPILGTPNSTTLEYNYSHDDEIEDLFQLLSKVKKEHPLITAVSCGAIGSIYQKNRFKNVCQRLSLFPLCPLWGMDEIIILNEMISWGLESVIIKTACAGLTKEFLLHPINAEFCRKIIELNHKYSVHACGEGGEYESLVLYCPGLYKKRIKILDSTALILVPDVLAPVQILSIHKIAFEDP
ncbi:hypothetical protein MXB_3126 [Myxobolus squamalis]|nr:hypothetical protein MXB_3126 [Myxobolus squamalis]